MKAAITRLNEGQFVAVRRLTIAQQAYAYLRREIIEARLLPRAPLSEQELALQLGVSRTPVREALIKLADEGLVDIYPQFGSFVAPIKLEEVFDSQFVRESLECCAIGHAVEKIDGAQIATLRTILEAQRAHHRAGRPPDFFAADERMHAFLMEVGGHGRVWPLVESAKAQLDRVRRLSIRSEIKLTTVLAEHGDIVDRVAARDRKGAVEALRLHLRGVFRSVEKLQNEDKQYFAEDGEGAPKRAQRGKPAPA